MKYKRKTRCSYRYTTTLPFLLSLITLYQLLLLNQATHAVAELQQCLNGVEIQSMKTDYSRAFEDLLDAATSISQNSKENTFLPIRDFRKAHLSTRSNHPMNLLKDACNSLGEDYHICSVTTTVAYNSSTPTATTATATATATASFSSSSTASRSSSLTELPVVVKEILKPVCFPDSCHESEVDILDPEPLFCLAENGCTVLSREVICPTRGTYPNGERPGNCEEEAVDVRSDSDIMEFTKMLEKRMNGECRKKLYGFESEWCSFHAVDTTGISSSSAFIQTHSESPTSLFEDQTGGQTKTDSPDPFLNMEHVSPLETYNVIKDYTFFNGSTFRQYSAWCASLGYTMCSANTEAALGDKRFYEINKPICVPDTCSTTSNVDAFDPHPICVVDGCQIISEEITCDSDPSSTSSTTTESVFGDPDACENDANQLLRSSEYQDYVDQLSNMVERDCANAIVGLENNECKVVLPTAGNITVGGIEMLDLDNNTIKNNEKISVFEGTCSVLGNQVCKVSATATTDIRDAFSFVDVKTQYVDVPACVPNECTDDIMKESAVNKAIFNCDERDQCSLSDVSIECTPREPTSFPSLAVSSTPSMIHSGVPTIEASEVPSVSPTEEPTISSIPSIMESMEPTSILSLTPSMVVSDSPSIEISMEPSSSPTLMSSEKPTMLRSSTPTMSQTMLITVAVDEDINLVDPDDTNLDTITNSTEEEEPRPLTLRERIFTRQNRISGGVMLVLFCICFLTICVETYRMS